ncbi:hypothetical protein M758_11G140400 [Ceratodon purpureus]|nr:hypothetical protein M758_11G140200 [Ceratodon purpureus]KAG0601802.1 hypothetical protein M758_11G140400 [Ceratodon purpureus]
MAASIAREVQLLSMLALAAGLIAVFPDAVLCGDSGSIKLGENGYNEQWMAGHATWYGEPNGEGSSGGACGYTKLTGTPYGPRIAAGNDAIFQGGKGCGQCYEVKCSYAECRQEATRIVITDQCPGGEYCSKAEPAFDLSGAAISAMALPDKDGALRNIGLYDILYKRVPCEFQGQNIAFQVDQGSTGFWLSFVVKFLGGPGDIDSVEIRHSGSSSFQPAKHNWGASWMLINTSGQAFKGPYDIRVVSKLNGHAVTAEKVIPEFFEPGKLYESNVQLKY